MGGDACQCVAEGEDYETAREDRATAQSVRHGAAQGGREREQQGVGADEETTQPGRGPGVLGDGRHKRNGDHRIQAHQEGAGDGYEQHPAGLRGRVRG